MVAAPRLSDGNPLSALAAALRITQAALEASQAATFGAEVCCRPQCLIWRRSSSAV